MKPFIIDKDKYSNYISTGLVSLFYKKSILDSVLCDDKGCIYLQEYVKTKFINHFRKNIYIPIETINTIRFLCIKNNFCSLDDIEYQNIYDFIDFIIWRLKIKTECIKLENCLITDGFQCWMKHNILNNPDIILFKVNNVSISKKLYENYRFFSAICYDMNYYCLLYKDKKYHLYSNISKPCVIEIKLNKVLKEKLKKECLIVIYKK